MRLKTETLCSLIELLATYKNFDSDDVIEALKEANVSELGNSIIICGYVLFEIIK